MNTLKRLTLIGCALAVFASTASAGVLCVRNKAKAKKGRVSLAKAFTSVADGVSCPKGSSVLVDTSLFKGDTGTTGAIGPKGNTGTTGDKGDTGTSGTDGETGVAGAQGPGGPSNFFTGGLQVSTGNPVTDYFLPSGYGTVEQSTQESLVRMPLASACTATNLLVRTSIGGGGPASITLRRNQVDTALTCAHTDNTPGPGAGCSSSAQVSLSQGDELSFRWTGELGNFDRVWVSWTCE